MRVVSSRRRRRVARSRHRPYALLRRIGEGRNGTIARWRGYAARQSMPRAVLSDAAPKCFRSTSRVAGNTRAGCYRATRCDRRVADPQGAPAVAGSGGRGPAWLAGRRRDRLPQRDRRVPSPPAVCESKLGGKAALTRRGMLLEGRRLLPAVLPGGTKEKGLARIDELTP
jgi:hypothetical protein